MDESDETGGSPPTAAGRRWRLTRWQAILLSRSHAIRAADDQAGVRRGRRPARERAAESLLREAMAGRSRGGGFGDDEAALGAFLDGPVRRAAGPWGARLAKRFRRCHDGDADDAVQEIILIVLQWIRHYNLGRDEAAAALDTVVPAAARIVANPAGRAGLEWTAVPATFRVDTFPGVKLSTVRPTPADRPPEPWPRTTRQRAAADRLFDRLRRAVEPPDLVWPMWVRYARGWPAAWIVEQLDANLAADKKRPFRLDAAGLEAELERVRASLRAEFRGEIAAVLRAGREFGDEPPDDADYPFLNRRRPPGANNGTAAGGAPR